MFDLSLPWWEFIARAAIVYAVLLVLVRISGKRTVGEFTPFDLLVVMLLAESTQGALVGGDESVGGSLIVAATLIAMNYAVGFASARSKAVDRVVEGEPVVLLRNGRVLTDALKRNNVPLSDLDESLRRSGITEHSKVEVAMLETNGDITVIRKRRSRS